MISQTAEYALRAAVWLAERGEVPQKAEQIAQGTVVPPDYLAKVLQALGRAGLVHAQRGKNGGYWLSRGPEEISVLDVIQAVDPVRRITHCPLNREAHTHRLCPLHQRLDDAMSQIERSFAETRLADVCEQVAAHA